MNSIEYLTASALAAAGRAGLDCRVERSSRSEATYVKVRRGGVWYGVRIAAHPPYYVCSQDCEQIIVPMWVAEHDELTEAEALLVVAVCGGGLPIADPDETALALADAAMRHRHGRRIATADGVRWRWDEPSFCWVRAGRRLPRSPKELGLKPPPPPAEPPRPYLPPWE